MGNEDRLAELLEQWEAAAANGRAVVPEELCRNSPTLLGEFTELLGQLGPVHAILKGDGKPLATAEELVGHINTGRFVPISFHAQGGLGVVFLADDQELHRPVALKRLQTLHAADASARARFHAEAEITGKLEHPGVVPVYGVGTDADGQPYYAMRFIHGTTLKDAAEQLHRSKNRNDPAWNLEFRRLLRSFVSICETMAYAHSRGVIHRDLKPANVMLGRYGETLVVDWGLAKVIDTANQNHQAGTAVEPICVQFDASGNTVGGSDTIDGEFKGSPAFMAPEQARGDWANVGTASDTYSLGATLYVLLTGKKPFEDASILHLFDDVKAGKFKPPILVDSTVPKALDAICRKAMSFHAKDRYASARHLADDIERWLADEPVSAWQEPWSLRVRRWMKRHRVLVWTASAIVLCVAIASSAAGIILGAKNRQLRKLNDDLSTSYTASRQEFEESHLALQGVVENVLARRRAGAEGAADAVRIDGLKKYRAYVNGFIDRNRGNVELRMQVAVALLRRGEIDIAIDAKENAIESCEQAKRSFEEITKADPDDREAQFGLASAIANRAIALVGMGRFADASPLLRDARDRFERLARDPSPIRMARLNSDASGQYPDSPAMQLARVTIVLTDVIPQVEAITHSKPGMPANASQLNAEQRRWIDAALFALTNGRELPLEAPIFIQHFAMILELLSVTGDGRGDAQRTTLERIAERNNVLIQSHPDFVELRLLTIESESRLAALAERDGKTHLVRKHLTNALEASLRLANAAREYDPFGIRDVAVVRLAEVSEKLAGIAGAEMNLPLATEYIQVCVQALDEYMAMKRHTPVVTARAVLVCVRMAVRASQHRDSRKAAESLYDAARKLCEIQLRESPGDPAFEIALVSSTIATAITRAANERPNRELIEGIEKLLDKLLADSPDDPILLIQRAMMTNARAAEASFVHNDVRRGIVLMDQALELLAAAEKLPAGAVEIATQKLWLEFQLASMLGMAAEDILKQKPKGDPEAQRLAARAIHILREQQKRSIPPTAFPEMDGMLQGLKHQRDDGILPLLLRLERRASGKE